MFDDIIGDVEDKNKIDQDEIIDRFFDYVSNDNNETCDKDNDPCSNCERPCKHAW